MGIRGLSSFIKQNPDICRPFRLHDTTVIFDGYNLMHMLYDKYTLDFRYGGEYKGYYDCAIMYLSSFLECNIKPIVVMDGGHEKTVRKLKSSIERSEKNLQRAKIIYRGQSCHTILPMLVSKVFHSVLFDLRIQVANSDYAADDQVAALGNYYNCPVISNDSDFYIFDSYNGYVPLDSIDTTIKFKVFRGKAERKFLNCKIYYIDEFVTAFPGLDKSVLPLFGTLIGSEFVEPKTFDRFFENVKLPKYKREWLSLDLSQIKDKKIVGLLCWLQHKTLSEATKKVIFNFEKNKQEYIKSIIDISVGGYKLNSCSLTFILEKNIDDPRNDLLSNTMLITPCNTQLPKTFVLKFHQTHLPSFFINVIVLHRVFLQVQVEDMKLNNSHSCSTYIRQIMYGILIRHDVNGKACKNQACLEPIEEYNRHERSIEKEQVRPLFKVKGIGLLPTVNKVHCIGEEECIAIITKVLGVNCVFFHPIPNIWQLFIGCINYWLRISRHRSEAFISALILNLIYFGLIKCKNPFRNQKRCPKKMPKSKKCACSSIACIARNISSSDLKKAGEILDEYYVNPTLNHNKGLFRNVAHSFSQIKSCLEHIIFLNQLLNEVFENPAPQECFSGAMLYNLTETIVSGSINKIIIGKILGRDLNILFIKLKTKVCENVPSTFLDEHD